MIRRVLVNPIPSYRADPEVGMCLDMWELAQMVIKGEEKRKWGEFCLGLGGGEGGVEFFQVQES